MEKRNREPLPQGEWLPVWTAVAAYSFCDCMKLSRSTISHHFKELQNAGLITCEREGQSFRCRINEEEVAAIRNFLK